MSQSISEGKLLHINRIDLLQRLYSVYGEFRTGKTQLAHTMSVVAQLPPELGGASGKVIFYLTNSRRMIIKFWKVAYIDTEGTFRPDRIRSIAERFGVDGSMALENILYGRTNNRVSSPQLPEKLINYSSCLQ